MAFESKNLGLLGSAVTESTMYSRWVYREIGVALATLRGAGYFANAGQDTTNGDAERKLRLNDAITIIGSDGVAEAVVTDETVGTVT